MTKDLTVGKPGGVLWRFSIPMFVSVIFQQIYQIADSVVAGKFAGESALAAVGASYPVTMIFMAVAVGSNIGCAVVISQLFGAKRYGEMKTAVNTTLLSCVVLSCLLTIPGMLFSRPIMAGIRTPVEIMDGGVLYLRIYIAGFFFLYLYNVCTGIFTSLGDSRTPLYFLIGSSICNVALDLLFVIKFHWGVAGVAWATFAAQGAACLLAVFTVSLKLKGIAVQQKRAHFSLSMFKKIAYVAVPSILQQSFISVGNIFIQGLVNGFGPAVIAGYSAAVKLNTFSVTSFTTLANGLSGFTAQNIGAGKTDRVKKGFWSGWMMAAAVAVPLSVVYFLFGRELIWIFMEEPGGAAMSAGVSFLKIVSPFYVVVGTKLMADGVLRGAGAMGSFMTATFTDLALRVLLSFVLAAWLGSGGIWLSWPIGWTAAACLSLFFYFRGRWMLCSNTEDFSENSQV